MATPVTEDEIGKRVISEDGEDLGMVASVEEETAYVEPEPGFIDRIKGAVGWESDAEDVVPIPSEAVIEITDDEVHLERQFTEGTGTADTGRETEQHTGTAEDTHTSEGPVSEMDETGGEPMGEMPSDEPMEGDTASPIDSDEQRPGEHGDAGDAVTDPMGEMDEGETELGAEDDISRESIEEIDEEGHGGASREIDPMEEGIDPDESRPGESPPTDQPGGDAGLEDEPMEQRDDEQVTEEDDEILDQEDLEADEE